MTLRKEGARGSSCFRFIASSIKIKMPDMFSKYFQRPFDTILPMTAPVARRLVLCLCRSRCDDIGQIAGIRCYNKDHAHYSLMKGGDTSKRTKTSYVIDQLKPSMRSTRVQS